MKFLKRNIAKKKYLALISKQINTKNNAEKLALNDKIEDARLVWVSYLDKKD